MTPPDTYLLEPAAVINQWEDWVHTDPRTVDQHPDVYSTDEITAMKRFDAVWEATADPTPTPLPPIEEVHLLGGGVDGAIHRAAGPELVQHCRNLGGCKTGQAKITPGFGLDAQWIIHTVGPVWRGGTNNEADLLASCYRESLARADEVKADQIAFPAISTGIFGYPIKAAARIAVDTMRSTLTKVTAVRFVAFDQEAWDAYANILDETDD